MDLTPLDIARTLGNDKLLGLLSPVIRHVVPSWILHKLETNFHSLIRSDLSGCDWVKHLYLPELKTLTEMVKPIMWFPLHGTGTTRKVTIIAR